MGLDWARAPWFTTAPAGKRGSPGASLVPKGWECLVPASRCSLRSLTLCSAQQPVCFSGFGASVCAGKGQRFFSVACLSLSHHFVLPPSEVEPLLTPSSPDFHPPPPDPRNSYHPTCERTFLSDSGRTSGRNCMYPTGKLRFRAAGLSRVNWRGQVLGLTKAGHRSVPSFLCPSEQLLSLAAPE